MYGAPSDGEGKVRDLSSWPNYLYSFFNQDDWVDEERISDRPQKRQLIIDLVKSNLPYEAAPSYGLQRSL